jgi:hypothetical protein
MEQGDPDKDKGDPSISKGDDKTSGPVQSN